MKEATLKIPYEDIFCEGSFDDNYSNSYETLFNDGVRGGIRVWMDEELYAEGYLIKDGRECCCTDAYDTQSEIEGDWVMENDGEQYILHVGIE